MLSSSIPINFLFNTHFLIWQINEKSGVDIWLYCSSAERVSTNVAAKYVIQSWAILVRFCTHSKILSTIHVRGNKSSAANLGHFCVISYTLKNLVLWMPSSTPRLNSIMLNLSNNHFGHLTSNCSNLRG